MSAAPLETADLIETIAMPERLALSYAPRSARDATLTFFALDARLGNVLRQPGEPIMAQMKLAWWRDRFGEDIGRWPKGEPLLARLHNWPADYLNLQLLIDGWEALLSEQLDEQAVRKFADGRAEAWRQLALTQAQKNIAIADRAAQAGREWALVDLAVHLGDGEADMVRELAVGEPWGKPRLPRSLRPLSVLNALAERALRGDKDSLLDSPRAALTALRVGITGR